MSLAHTYALSDVAVGEARSSRSRTWPETQVLHEQRDMIANASYIGLRPNAATIARRDAPTWVGASRESSMRNDPNEPSGSVASRSWVVDLSVGSIAAIFDIAAASGLDLVAEDSVYTWVPLATGLVAGFMLGRGGALLAAIAYWPSALIAIAVSGSNVVLPCVAVFFVWPTLLFFLTAAVVEYLRHPIRDGDAGSDSPGGGARDP